MSPFTLTNTSASAVTHSHVPSEEMPQTCNEPAHVYHITVIAPPSSCEYAHLARTRHVTVVPFLWSNIFSSLKYCPVAKALNKGTTLKYHAEEEIHQITCRARSLPHVRQHTWEVRVTYCTAWPACRAILLRLLLRPGLGEEPGGQLSRWTNQIKEQDANWAETVAFHLHWNQSSGVQKSEACPYGEEHFGTRGL